MQAFLKGRSPGADAARAPLLGDLLIVVAQVLQALQFIIEEKYLAKVCMKCVCIAFPASYHQAHA